MLIVHATKKLAQRLGGFDGRSRPRRPGGTSGIGHAIATGFAGAGADVVVTGTRQSPAEYDTDLTAFTYRQLQVADPDSVDSLVTSLDALDVLVNKAGANLPGGLNEWDPEGFAASVALNLVGPMRLAVGCRKLLFVSELPGGASVVNMASMSAFRAATMVPGYASAKAGIVTLTANLAHKWAARGVRRLHRRTRCRPVPTCWTVLPHLTCSARWPGCVNPPVGTASDLRRPQCNQVARPLP